MNSVGATGGKAPKNSRTYCCDCGREAVKGKRILAGAPGLWPNLVGRMGKKGRAFSVDDYFCNKCQCQVREKGKSYASLIVVPVNMEQEDGRGEAEIENGDGEMEIENGGGEMEIENGGGEMENGGGDLEMENGGGDLEMENGGGDLEMENGGGDLEMENGGGDLEMEKGGDELENGNGEIEMEDGGGESAKQKDGGAKSHSDSFGSWSQMSHSTDPRAMVSASFSEGDSQDLFNFPRRRAERLELPGTLGVGSSQSFCCVCHSTSGRSVVPIGVSHHFMCETGIWLPSGNRICQAHIVDGRLTEEATHTLRDRAKNPATTTASDVAKIFRILTTQSPIQRIDVDRLDSEGDYWMLFGVTRKNFDDLYRHIQPHLRDTLNRSSRNALAMFLMKLRMDLTQRMLGWLFGCPQEKVSETFWRVNKLLGEHFVEQNIGFGHMTREQALQKHDLQFARSIFNIPEESLPLLFDCTYLYTEEPSDHVAQKKSFCMFKGSHLLKPMTVCFADGYILDSAGLYYSDSNHNDARILKDMVDQINGISDFIQAGDFFIVDRGFRDLEEKLTSEGYEVRMPACIQKRGKGRPAQTDAATSRKRGSRSSKDQPEAPPQRQLTTEEANQSKLIMFLRWVVEAAHGRVKNMFTFFDHTIDSNYFRKDCDKKLTSLYRIACAIVNKYQPPLLQDSPAQEVILRNIEENLNKPNSLMDIVIENRMGTVRKAYVNLSGREDLQDFPQLSLEEIRAITATQLPLRKWDRYNEEFLRLDRDYTISYYTHDDSIIRVKLASKYKSRTVHMLWIQYVRDSTDSKITGWYCKCQVGARTLGCCCHVASVLYYLGYKRHLEAEFSQPSYGSGIIDITLRQAQVEGYAECDDQELLDV